MYVVGYTEYKRKFVGNVVISESGQLEGPEEWDYEPEVDPIEMDAEELAKKQHDLIGVAPSQFVEFAVKVPDKVQQKHVNFSFSNRRYLRLPYDTPAKRTLYKCGRQVEKSTLLGNKTLSYCCINNSFNVLYVSPTNQQTKTFSADRLKEPIETSEALRAWTTTKLSDNVFLKKFINRSQITLRYAYHNADRTRGIPADLILIDEIQDVIADNIPVIEQCASHSPYRLFIYSGTPKTFDNPLEAYWTKFSTQNEWVVPCEHHTPWHWNILGEGNITKEALVCEKCKRPINAMHPNAQWAAMNQSVHQRLSADGVYEGFRIPQLMVPWIKWNEIWDNYVKYPKNKFHNEVLGLSYDTGTRPLTRQDILDNCLPSMRMDEPTLKHLRAQFGGATQVYAGIDWGTGEGSFSVITLGAYINGFFTIFYMHRFEGQETEPPVQLEIIYQLVKYWNIEIIGTDYGGGFDRNDSLARKYGTDRMYKYQYSQPSVKVQWQGDLKRFLVHRTEVMSDIFNAIKRRNVFRFPAFDSIEEPFTKDFLNIFSEFNEQRREIQYKKAPDSTDDTFHSMVLCFLASMIRWPRPDVLNPNQKTGAVGDDES